MSYHQRTLEVQSLINRGDPEEPANAPERFDRWRIMMNPSDDARTIAEALDHFKFELGLIGGGRKGVDYLSDLRLPRPTKSVMNDPAKEKRIYLMMVGESPLKRFAKSCFSRASVSTQDRMTLLLVPTNVEILLANLEREYCEEHGITSVADVKRTMFRVGKRHSSTGLVDRRSRCQIGVSASPRSNDA